MTKEDLIFLSGNYYIGIIIHDNIIVIGKNVVDDYVFVDQNINEKIDIDNLTVLSKDEITSINTSTLFYWEISKS